MPARALIELLGLPALDLPTLRATVTAGPRACVDPDVDPDLFFDDVDPDGARTVCAVCPVRAACLAAAMSAHVEMVDGTSERSLWGAYGVWGGLTSAERLELLPTWAALRRLAGEARPARVCAACDGPLPEVRAGRRPGRTGRTEVPGRLPRTCSPACAKNDSANPRWRAGRDVA